MSFDSNSPPPLTTAALQEAVIERKTACCVAEMVQEFEINMTRADQELEEVIASAQSLLGDRQPVGHEYHALICATPNENKMDNEVDLAQQSETGTFREDVVVDIDLATKLSKVLRRHCEVDVGSDGESATISVTSLVDAVKLLLEERHDFIQEAQDLMAISRRTVHLALNAPPARPY